MYDTFYHHEAGAALLYSACGSDTPPPGFNWPEWNSLAMLHSCIRDAEELGYYFDDEDCDDDAIAELVDLFDQACEYSKENPGWGIKRPSSLVPELKEFYEENLNQAELEVYRAVPDRYLSDEALAGQLTATVPLNKDGWIESDQVGAQCVEVFKAWRAAAEEAWKADGCPEEEYE